MTSYVVVDLETTVNNDQVGKFGGSPYYPANRIVMAGWLGSDSSVNIDINPDSVRTPDTRLLIGHNIGFDLAYMLRDEQFSAWFWGNRVRVWDTMVAQYIISGQQDQYASLNYCSGIYGGTQKIDAIKEMWDNGIKTEDMDPDLLQTYLIGDLRNTETVYKGQLRIAQSMGILPLLSSMMEAVLCTTEMEFNGLHFDTDIAQAAIPALRDAIAEAEEAVIVALVKDCKDFPYWFLNVGSDEQISSILFGGDFKYECRDYALDDNGDIQHYKGGARAGQAKTKIHKRRLPLSGICRPGSTQQKGAAGYYGVGEDKLKKIKHPAVVSILAYRGLIKDLNTYYIGYSAMTWQHDGCIHHKLNTVSTETGRLSSSQPNLQNVNGKGDIKNCFTSRWGSDGVILQGDYSQLEVVYQAWVSGDEAMSKDIIDGVDFHCKRLAYKTGEDYDHVFHMCKVVEDPEYLAARKDIKSVSFQKSYGAGIKAVSESTGIPKEEVKAIFEAEDMMYYGVVLFNQQVAAEVEQSAVLTSKHSFAGYPVRKGTYRSVTGRRYVFTEDDAPQFMKDRGSDVSFSPTKIKNYPINS